MQKLLAKFRQTQKGGDALRLLAYLDKHPMGICAAVLSDRALIRDLQAKRARAIHAVACAKAA